MNHPINKTLETFQRWKEKVSSSDDRSLIERQISLLEEIKESLVEYGTMRHKISSFEKLISDSWLNDRTAFEELYSSWKDLKESYSREVSTMTVNEMLCHMGLMEEFDRVSKSPQKMRAVLYSTLLSRDNIEAIIENQNIQ